MSAETWLWLGLAAAVPAIAILTSMALRAAFRSSGLPPAKPGSWFGSYHRDWSAAHPGAFERGESRAGSFYAGDKWGSSTLDWDREWFHRNGMGMPRNSFKVDGRAKPNEIRIGTLGPGESVSIPLTFTKGDQS